MAKLLAVEPEGKGGNFTPIPAGTHIAVISGVIDLGTQLRDGYQGAPAKKVHRVAVCFDIPSETVTIDGKEMPRTITKKYTLSLHEKSQLRKDIESLRGKRFQEKELKGWDLSILLGKPCSISISNGTSAAGREYAAVQAVTALPKGVTAPVSPRETVFWSMADWEEGMPMMLPDVPQFLQDIIMESDEYKAITGTKTAVVDKPKVEPTEAVADDEEAVADDENESCLF